MGLNIARFFEGVGAKRLSGVEVNSALSNQHEFNGVSGFRRLFGNERVELNARFIIVDEESDTLLEREGTVTWYDARERHPTRSEFRLYYSGNEVMRRAAEGDLLIIAKLTGESKVIIIIAKATDSLERQLLWLFGLGETHEEFVFVEYGGKDIELNYSSKQLIEHIGLELQAPDVKDWSEILAKKFGSSFPSTKVFSEYAREQFGDADPVGSPDTTLMGWMDIEETLFKAFEKTIVQEKLKKGFGKSGTDVDEFIQFSLSVQNRRKSRAGFAFENHLEALFKYNSVKYSRGSITENKSKPDFVFPSINEYHSSTFDSSLLTMLGLKTTAKDRWRQVLTEAEKIRKKHLITLEPGISVNQTNEMRAQHLQLVVPKDIIGSYNQVQQSEMLTLIDFVTLVKERQRVAGL